MATPEGISVSAQPQRRKRRRKRALWVALAALVLLPLTCVLTVRLSLHVPPVEGVVTNGTTGKPVAGARVFFAYKGYFRGPLAIVGGSNRSVLAAGETLTDSEGRFRFPGSTFAREWSEAPYWPRALGIEVIACAKETMPVWSRAGGLDWTEDLGCLPHVEGVKVMRENSHSSSESFKYRIATVTPRTEQEWEEKVIWTSHIAADFSNDIWEQYLYDDCVAFVERYPSNPLAGECVSALLGTTHWTTEEYLRDALRVGEERLEDLPLFIRRSEKVLQLAKAAPPPTTPTRLDFRVIRCREYESELESVSKSLECMRRAVAAGGKP